MTIGELKDLIKDYPDDFEFNVILSDIWTTNKSKYIQDAGIYNKLIDLSAEERQVYFRLEKSYVTY